MERKNAWKTYDEAQMKELQQLNADYINFLSECKTERECVKDTVRRVEEKGYIATGSTITHDVPDGALAIARERQVIKEGWVEKKNQKDDQSK